MKVSKIYEMLLYLYIAGISLIPMQGMSFFGVDYFTVFSLIALLLASPLFFFKRKDRPSVFVFYLFICLILLALISTYLHTYLINKLLIILPLLYSLLAIVLPYTFSKIVSSKSIDHKKHFFNLARIITIATILLGLYHSIMSSDVNFRLTSPIGGAAVIHVVLILIMGVYLANIKVSYKTKSSYIYLFLTMSLTILTGSRAGLITMCLLLFLYFINFKKPIKSFFTFLLVSALLLISLWLLPTDRYGNFESEARVISFTTSLNIATNSTSNLIFGAGQGVIFPWYAYETGHLSYDKISNMVSTEQGYLLTNPHSVYIGILTELGLVGLVLFISIIFLLIKGFIKTTRLDNTYIRIIMLSILCTLPSFAVDYYLFKNFVVSTIWWYFVFFAIPLTSTINKKDSK